MKGLYSDEQNNNVRSKSYYKSKRKKHREKETGFIGKV